MRTGYLLRIPQNLKGLLEKRAEEMGISLNALLLQILWEWETSKGR